MYRSNVLALAAILAMQATAFEAGAACTAEDPNPSLIESTPASAFTDHGNGTLTHSLTGLMWKQCAQGLSGAGCATGSAATMTWRGALAAAAADATAGNRDWRVPNKKELESILELCGRAPAINRTLFPATPASPFWSGSSFVPQPTGAWNVNFDNGNSDKFGKTNDLYVRLVRGGQSLDSIDAQTVEPGVVEYLNTADFPNSPGGHFFYSSDAAEQAAVDAGAAGAFERTGRQFLTGGTSPVCRFYGSVKPGPNSHFFTVNVDECNALKALQVTPTPTDVQQWNYERIEYSTTPANVVNGMQSCPAGTLPVYRAYNNAFPLAGPKNPWDSNHRFTPRLSDIADMVANGWREEGIVFCTPAQAGTSTIDGIWEAAGAGVTDVLALVERADGRLLGYRPSSPASWIAGGQRAGSSVTINLDSRDPAHASDPGTIAGIRSGSRIAGMFTGGAGNAAVTFERVDALRTVAHWLLAPSTQGSTLNRALRVENSAGEFVAGGFVGIDDCSFLACNGRINSWTTTGATHAILTESAGACPSTSTLTGTWDIPTLLLNGTYSMTANCPPAPAAGSFFGGKEGLTNSSDILDVLGLLRDFADRVEAESPAAADVFAATYLHEGKTRADWQAYLASLYAGFDNLRVTIDAVRQIVTFADAEVNPKVLSPPRVEWHLSIAGMPLGGGPAVAVTEVTSAFDGEQQLYWIGREAGRMAFKGNGYAAPFSIAVPVQAGDSTRIAYGVWPYGVHGGGHPEGHPGWDLEYVAGRMVRAAADGVVNTITANTEFPGQVDVGVQHRPGYATSYGHIGALDAGIAVGVSVVGGQALGAAGNVGPFNMTHFGLNSKTDSACPLDYLSASGLALFNVLWQTAAYEEELVEPFPCNPVAVSFPRTRAWTRSSGSMAPVIEFTRLDPQTTDYRYTLRASPGGIVLESGALVALQPSVTLESGTFDLQRDGSATATQFARYRIDSDALRIAWAATRPADLSGASVYSTPAP